MGVNFKTNFDYNNISLRLEKAAKKAMFDLSKQALEDCNDYCKKQSGELINSSHRASDLEKGLLIWDTPYAKTQYYLDKTWTNTNSKASKMWVHKAHSVRGEVWDKILHQKFKLEADKK